MPEPIKGQRVEHGGGALPAPGSYWRDARDGEWYGVAPNGTYCGFRLHSVTEHADGTITVAPSIECGSKGVRVGDRWQFDTTAPDYYHGFLEVGVWRSCL